MLIDAAQVPDLTFLRDLEPGVAILALIVVLAIVVLFYVGPPLRSRLERAAGRPDPAAAPEAASPTAAALTGQVPAAMDRTDAMSERFITHLLGQLADNEREKADSDREKEALRVEVARLNQRLTLITDEVEQLRAREQRWRSE